MVKFSDVTENETLDYGRHLVKVTESRNTTKDGDLLLDEEGKEVWSVTFQNEEGARRYEYFNFSGWKAKKTGGFLKAVGLLEPDEKLSECDKEFSHEDVNGCYLYITIVENPNAKSDKWKKVINPDGFEKYEKAVAKKTAPKKVEPKVEVVEDDENVIPF